MLVGGVVDLGSSGFVGSAGKRFSTVIVGGVGAFGSVGFLLALSVLLLALLGRPTFELMANQ